MYQRDETPYEKKLKEEQFERFKNVMDQFVSPQPEADRPMQIPAVSGCDESWKFMHRQIVDVYNHTCKIEFHASIICDFKSPVSVEYEVKDGSVINWISNYLIEDADGYCQPISIKNDDKIKIKLQFNENTNWCVEEIYFHHGR